MAGDPANPSSGIDPRKWFQASSVIAFCAVITFCVLLVWWSYSPPALTQEQASIWSQLLQILNTIIVGVIAYYMKRE